MKQVFISYVGRMDGLFAHGWVVVAWPYGLSQHTDIERLVRFVETERGYDKDTLCPVSFHRLEK